MPLKYKGIGKGAKDLLSKKYDYDFSLETTNKSKDGLTMTSGFTMESRTDLSGSAKMEYEDPSINVEVNMKVNGKQEDEDTNLKCTFNKLMNGLDVSLSCNVIPELTVEKTYVHDSFAINAKLVGDLNFSKACLNANGAFSANNFTAGLNAAVDLLKQEAKTIDLGLQFQQKPHSLSFIGKKLQTDAKSFLFGYHNSKVPFCCDGGDLAVGAHVLVKEVTKDDSSSFEPTATLGVDWGVSPTTSLKAKVDCCGLFSYAVEHKLSNPAMKVNFAHAWKCEECCVVKTTNWGFGLTLGNY